jgi:hypothetical protein
MSELTPERIAAFNAVIEDCENFTYITRDSELQKDACARLQELMATAASMKSDAVAAGDEDSVNLLLDFECVAKCIHAELSMWLLLKEQRPDEAWDNLVTAQLCAVAAARAHRGFAHLEQQTHHLEAIEKVLFPRQIFLSAGFLVGRQECSICGSEYGVCDHLAGKPYMGKFCSIVARDLRGDHVATVKDPADKRCRIVNFGVEGGIRNRMTWKVQPPQEANPGNEPLSANSSAASGGLMCGAIIATSSG